MRTLKRPVPRIAWRFIIGRGDGIAVDRICPVAKKAVLNPPGGIPARRQPLAVDVLVENQSGTFIIVDLGAVGERAVGGSGNAVFD
jgi:hypothetical protein